MSVRTGVELFNEGISELNGLGPLPRVPKGRPQVGCPPSYTRHVPHCPLSVLWYTARDSVPDPRPSTLDQDTWTVCLEGSSVTVRNMY